MKLLLALLSFILVCSMTQAEIRNTFLTPKGKVLVVLSSQSQLGNSDIKTGIWLPDATHPFSALINSGYDVDFASPQGGAVPIEIKSDPRNLNSMNTDDVITRGFLADDSSFAKLANTKKLSEIQAKDYSSVIVAGGMAAMYDLPDNQELRNVLKDFWAQNKIISAIHYGVYGVLKMTTPSGKQVLRGVELTAISRDEEKKFAELLGWRVELLTPKGFLQDQIKKEGAGYKSGPSFSSFTYVGAEKHFLTAQQPFSGLELGLNLVKAMDKTLKPYVPKSQQFLKMKAVSR